MNHNSAHIGDARHARETVNKEVQVILQVLVLEEQLKDLETLYEEADQEQELRDDLAHLAAVCSDTADLLVRKYKPTRAYPQY